LFYKVYSDYSLKIQEGINSFLPLIGNIGDNDQGWPEFLDHPI
jgi:hypothetical protein